jgi:hypothetical protein
VSVCAHPCRRPTVLLFAWLISHQPAVLFSRNKPATNNQPPANDAWPRHGRQAMAHGTMAGVASAHMRACMQHGAAPRGRCTVCSRVH